MKKIIIVCDGACSGNGKNANNPGGWGAVLLYKDQKKEIFGGSPSTTNNIMELTAVIEALKCLKESHLCIEIFSDSAYIVNCFKNKWYQNWERNGWITSKKEPVENQELWKELLQLVASFKEVYFYKIKGHLNINQNQALEEWYKKFKDTNQLNYTLEHFIEIVKLNHLADELANKGMDSIR